MADNVTVDNGGGTDYTVATNELTGGEHAQVVQIIASDAATADDRVPASETDGLLVNLGSNNDVTVTGSVTANAGTNLNTSALSTSAKQDTIIGHVDGIETLLGTIDADTSTLAGAVAGTEMQVDIVSGSVTADTELTTADLDTGAGTDTRAVVGLVGSKSGGGALIPGDATAGLKVDLGADNDVTVTGTVTVDGSGVTQPVSHAALTELAAAIDTELQVDVVGALPAGTNNIGDVDVASIAAGDNNIGNVDIVTVPADPFGANADAAATAGSTGSIQAKLRLVTSQLDAIKTAVETLDNTVGGSELQVDIVSAPTLTVNSHAVTNAGTFAVQVDGAALTALQLIDDSVVADDGTFTPGTTKVMMAGFEADESSTDSVDEGDGGAARMTLDRKLIVNNQPHSAGGCSIHRSIDLDEGTLEVVKNAPGTVYGMWVTNTATATRFIKFYDATSGTAGTGTPVITIGIPGNSSDDVAGAFGPAGVGIAFATGICVGATTGVADNDTGAPGANDVVVNIFYK